MSEVARPGADVRGGQPVADLLVDVATPHARPGDPLHDRERFTSVRPRRLLLIGRPPVHGDHPRRVGEVAAVGRAKIEDVEVSGDALPVPRRSPPDAAGVIVAGAREHLPAGGHRRRLQLGEHGEFAYAGGHHLAGPGDHGAGGIDRPLEHGEFVGILAPALAEEFGLDVFDGGVAEPAGDVWRAGRELHAHAAGRPAGGEPVAEDGRGGLALIVPQGGSPLRRVGSHLVGSGLIHGPVGTNQQHVARGEHRGQR